MDMTATKVSNSTVVIPSIAGNYDLDVIPLPDAVPTFIIIHAICFAGSFFLLFPLGVVALRWFGRVRWHWMLQALATLICVLGFAMAFAFSFMDPEYHSFNESHQVIGIIVVAALIVQVCLGYSHHRNYQKLAQRTWVSISHLWVGRVVIVLGMVNAILYVHVFLS